MAGNWMQVDWRSDNNDSFFFFFFCPYLAVGKGGLWSQYKAVGAVGVPAWSTMYFKALRSMALTFACSMDRYCCLRSSSICSRWTQSLSSVYIELFSWSVGEEWKSDCSNPSQVENRLALLCFTAHNVFAGATGWFSLWSYQWWNRG